MNKSELINELSEETTFSKMDVTRVLDSLTRVISRALKKGEKVGRVFWTSNRDQIHRKTGEKIPGDHYKTTGIHDPNSNADLILQITDKNGKHLR